MLRISVKKDKDRTHILSLEGKISKSWVDELRVVIEKALAQGDKVILDFCKVSFLDDSAAEMLQRFSQDQVEKKNCSLLIRTLLGLDER